MALFITLMYLLSITVGYCAAFASWTKKFLLDSEMPYSMRKAVYPDKGRAVFVTAAVLSPLAAGYGFWRYGLMPGSAIGFSFLAVAALAYLVLRPRMNTLFHLNLVLKALAQRHLDCLYCDDVDGANAIEGVIEKVTKELYAIKVVKSAELVPTYEGSKVYLSINGAKADNYHCSERGSSRQR